MSQPARRTLSSLLNPPTVAATKNNMWDELCTRIKDGNVIPILSNSIHGDEIFGPLLRDLIEGESEHVGYRPTIDEMLAEVWADRIGYPLHDRQSLVRVALYNRLKSADAEQARRNYLVFLKETLLTLVEKVDPASGAIVQGLRGQVRSESNFSDIVAELDLHAVRSADDDPLRLLARLNLPIYVTTSYYDFLERAIQAEGRTPHTQICGNLTDLRPEHRLGRDFEPTAQNPVVYHLHGHELYPASMVLSEDDYVSFLVRVTQPVDPQKPVIPLYLTEKLAESTLLLLGYRLQDWDFRAIFRGLIAAKDTPRRSFSVAIQLAPAHQGGAADAEEAERYLFNYFKSARFEVEWSDSVAFIRKLWNEWNRWRQG